MYVQFFNLIKSFGIFRSRDQGDSSQGNAAEEENEGGHV